MGKKLFFILLIFGCAKSPEYKEVYKEPEKTNRFSDYDLESVYLYVPSTLGTPRKITSMRPFFQGSEQLVKLKWTKEGLSVYGSDEDFRFDFSRNQIPVFTIPGSYKAYRCSKNTLGECSNKEEENNEINWNERPYFYPDLANIDFKTSINVLDLVMENHGCFIEKKQSITDYLIKKGIINIEVEKEYVVSKSSACLIKYLNSDDLDLRDLSFKTTFYYSLVRLKDLASPDYIPINYSLDDQSKFGFFKNIQKIYDENYFRKIENVFLNRWNPAKKKIIYHLSDSFNEEGQEIFKQISLKAFEDMNAVFKESKIPLELELLEPSGKRSGDLRYNMVVLITDPLENGLLGYGPSVSNPLTGEILSAHVNMYSGVLRRMVPSVYKKMLKLSYDEAKLIRASNPAMARALEMLRTPDRRVIEREKFLGSSRALMADPRVTQNPDFYSKGEGINPSDFEKLGKDSYTENLEFLTKHNAYPSELYLSGGKDKKYIEGIKEYLEIWNKDQTLKDWEELSKNQKEKISKMILPHVYRTTFIHEIGHNLGLRHNFKGSADESNFYFKKDLEEGKSLFGIPFNYLPSYSSIMDYGYSELNELPIFGKYDLAALRFAYAQEVELKDGSIKKLDEKGLTYEDIREFEFCTDENVGTSPLCDRFDEGATYTEIMEHYEKKYKDFYETRNFRNNRDDFNLLTNRDYYFARKAEFKRIRKVFETWEFYANQAISDKKNGTLKEHRNLIQKMFGACADSDRSYCKSITDIDNATKLAGRFFLEILKTPEHECLIMEDGKEKILFLEELHNSLRANEAPKSCFEPRLVKSPQKVIGERGKFLKDQTEYDPKYKYSSDLSARGIWIDKLLAMENLIGRNLVLNRYDDPQLSFLDHPELGPQIEKFIDDLILQHPIENPAPFTDKFGKVVEPSEDYSKIIMANKNNPLITEQASRALIYNLNLPPDSYFFLSKGLLNTLLNYSKSADPNLSKKTGPFFTHLGVKKVADHISLDSRVFYPELILDDGNKYAGSSSYDLASQLINDILTFNSLENYKPLIDHIKSYDPPESISKIAAILNKLYYLKRNPYLDISQRKPSWQDPISELYNQSEGAKKKSLEMSVKVLEEIIKVYDDPEIGKEYFEKIFTNELNIPERALFLKKNLSKDELIKSQNFLSMTSSISPDFPFKELYKISDEKLKILIELTEEKNKVELEEMLKGLKAF